MMDFQNVLSIYIDKFGEDHDINTIHLTEEQEEDLYNLLLKSISTNEPISKKQLEEIFGYDADDPDILI